MRRCVDVRCTSMDDYDVRNLPQEKLVVCVSSTTGEGEVPDNMRSFWRFLLRKDLPAGSLQAVRHASFGLGDSSYAKFNYAAKRLHRRLEQLGSRAVADLYGGAPFDINPRRGQFLVYDRQASSLLTRILLPLPTKQTKGMLVAPTIFGNVISGARKKKRRVVFPSCAIISFMKRAIICQDRLGTG